MSIYKILAIAITLIAIVAAYKHKQRQKQSVQTIASAPVERPPAAPASHAGTYRGTLTPGSTALWGGPGDEHEPTYTADILKERPDWAGLGYCPSGQFEFTVAHDGTVSGHAWGWGADCPVEGTPVLVGNSIEFTVWCHWVRLEFNNGAVTGLLWEGHDLLKRAHISGVRV